MPRTKEKTTCLNIRLTADDKIVISEVADRLKLDTSEFARLAIQDAIITYRLWTGRISGKKPSTLIF